MADPTARAAPKRAWRRLGRWLGRSLLSPRGARRLQATLAARNGSWDGAFFVIAPPGSWALLRPCVQLLRERALVCAVGNGAGYRERALFARRFPEVPRFDLPVLPGTLWSHGSALNLLVRGVPVPFGVVDHDCYVFDGNLLSDLACGDSELALAIDLPGFFAWNARAGLRLPRTHWLFLNAPLLRRLMRRHGVDCEKSTRTPRRIRSLLARIDIGDGNFPSHLPFYDTLQLLLVLGLALGTTVRYLPTRRDGVVHFGGATRQRL